MNDEELTDKTIKLLKKTGHFVDSKPPIIPCDEIPNVTSYCNLYRIPDIKGYTANGESFSIEAIPERQRSMIEQSRDRDQISGSEAQYQISGVSIPLEKVKETLDYIEDIGFEEIGVLVQDNEIIIFKVKPKV